MSVHVKRQLIPDKELSEHLRKSLLETRFAKSVGFQQQPATSDELLETNRKFNRMAFGELSENFSFMTTVYDFVNERGNVELFEKSLGTQRAPQVRPIRMPSSDKFSGHVGSGQRPQSRVGRPRPPTPPQPSSVSPSAISPIIQMLANGKEIKPSTENWEGHPHVRVGAFAFVHHPYVHEAPVWTRILSIGKHGICAKDDNDKDHNVRWIHVYNVHLPAGSGPDAGEKQSAILEMKKLGMPVEQDELDARGIQEAQELLRNLKLPLHDDMIHDGHDDRDAAYEFLDGLGIPTDPVASTRKKDVEAITLPQHLHLLAEEIQGKGNSIDVPKLSKLSKKDIIAVLNHYFKDEKDTDVPE